MKGKDKVVSVLFFNRSPRHRRLDGPQSRSGYGGKEKNSQPLPGLEPPIIQPVAR